jgi:uncharacterized repeat protein (TIGR02543 family)
MRPVLRKLTALLTVSLLLVPSYGYSAQNASAATDVYIIEFAPGAKAADEAQKFERQGFKVNTVYKEAINGIAVSLPSAALAGISRNPNVLGIYPNAVATKVVETDNPTKSWGLDRSDQRSRPLDNSYTYDPSAPSVDIYVLDTGLNSSLTEFSGRTSPGRNFMTDKSATDTTDCDGHGTHVSGTAMGTNYGIAKTARVIPVRVLDCFGSGTATAILDGIDWVIAQAKASGKPSVANMSLGFGGTYSPVDTAVQNLVNNNVTAVVAAGNSGRNACNYTPARASAAITVAASTSSDARSSFSNFGSCVDIFAPGSGITSVTQTGAAASWNGTSMASPHVAGAAALVLSQNASFTPAQVTNTLISDSTKNIVSSAGTGSPNRLLFIPAPTDPVTTYTVSYNANSGSGTVPTSCTVAAGSSCTVASGSALARTGYTFSGWNTAQSGVGGTAYSAGNSITPTLNTTLFAQWSAQTYSVSFVTDGSSVTNTSYVTGGSFVLPTTSKPDHTLLGWFTAAIGGTKLGDPGSSVTPASPFGNLTVYAQWQVVDNTAQAPDQVATPSLSLFSRTLTATWAAPADNGSAISGYMVRLYKNGSLVGEYAVGTSRSWSLTTSPGRYRVSIAAVNEAGTGAFSTLSNEVRIR